MKRRIIRTIETNKIWAKTKLIEFRFPIAIYIFLRFERPNRMQVCDALDELRAIKPRKKIEPPT